MFELSAFIWRGRNLYSKGLLFILVFIQRVVVCGSEAVGMWSFGKISLVLVPEGACCRYGVYSVDFTTVHLTKKKRHLNPVSSRALSNFLSQRGIRSNCSTAWQQFTSLRFYDW